MLNLNGSGSKEDPYLIRDFHDLRIIRNGKFRDHHYKLVEDIDGEGEKIGPITKLRENDVFDGNGHTIRNLEVGVSEVTRGIGDTKTWTSGLFRRNSGVIKNINIENIEISSNKKIEFGFITNHNVGSIINCSVKNAGIEAPSNSVGGIVGANESTGEIINSKFEGYIISSKKVGGIAGRNNGTVKGCSSKIMMKCTQDICGGIIGSNWFEGNVKECESEVYIVGVERCGGISGTNQSVILNCSSNGHIKSESIIGGIIGENDGRVEDSNSDAELFGEDLIGGLVGINNGPLKHSSFVGNLNGDNRVGSICGVNRRIVTNCHSIKQVCENIIGKKLSGRVDSSGLEDNKEDIEEAILIGKI